MSACSLCNTLVGRFALRRACSCRSPRSLNRNENADQRRNSTHISVSETSHCASAATLRSLVWPFCGPSHACRCCLFAAVFSKLRSLRRLAPLCARRCGHAVQRRGGERVLACERARVRRLRVQCARRGASRVVRLSCFALFSSFFLTWRVVASERCSRRRASLMSVVARALRRKTRRHPWFDVTMANWRKYPNKRRPDLVSADIIDKHVDAAGVLHIKRLLIIEGVGYPPWLKKVRACVRR